MGRRYLEDVLETMGAYIDVLKFAGGSFSLMPRKAVKELLDICHRHDVLVSTGGFIEHVLTQDQRLSTGTLRNARSLASILSKYPVALSPYPRMTGCAWSKKYKKPG